MGVVLPLSSGHPARTVTLAGMMALVSGTVSRNRPSRQAHQVQYDLG
jgi:hypothetical protein